MARLKRNSAKCAHCGYELISTHVHDFRGHHCEKAGLIAKKYNHDTKSYEPCVPAFWVDGGLEYCRRMYTRPEDFIDTSEYEDESKKAD